MNERLLSSATAATRLGVSPSSIKRWADSGVLPCVVTPGGHRRFTIAAVDNLRRGAPRGTPESAAAPPVAAVAPWLDCLLDAASPLAVDAELLDARGRLGSWSAVAVELQPVLIELGQRWHDGQISVLDEHRASERLARGLAQRAEALPPRPDAPRILLALAEGEQHALGLRLAELCLREAGWLVQWAGERTPVTEILDAVRERAVDAVGVSAAPSHPDAASLDIQARALEAGCRRSGVALLLGGSGRWPRDLEHARRVETLEELRVLLEAERHGEWSVRP